MDQTDTSRFALIGKFAKVAKLWQQLDNQPRQFGTGENLSGPEIHVIEVVGQHEGLSVTSLANRLGVTKGAASQTLKKMESKELIIRDVDPSNSSRVTLGLSTKGKIAFYAHLHWHETVDGGFRDYFMNLPDDKIKFLEDFLTSLEQFLKQR
jgi:DNA-binding MarR family transcriptional regulator